MGDRVARGEAEQALGPLYEGPHVTSRGSEWYSSKTRLRERLLWWQAVQERDKMAGRQEATECQRGDGEVRAGPEAGEVLGGSRSLADTTCVWAEFTSKREEAKFWGQEGTVSENPRDLQRDCPSWEQSECQPWRPRSGSRLAVRCPPESERVAPCPAPGGCSACVVQVGSFRESVAMFTLRFWRLESYRSELTVMGSVWC